jgi:hypothetical protein
VPLGFAGAGKEYVMGTWQDEFNKTSGQGLSRQVKAVISAELRMGLDAFDLVKGYLNKGKQEANKKIQ